MQNEALSLLASSDSISENKSVKSGNTARTLAAFQAHMNKTGKVCLKPWQWRRFCNLFKALYEPPWLSSWWEIPVQDKKDLFIKQLEYLALQTNRFDSAHEYLLGLSEENWHIIR